MLAEDGSTSYVVNVLVKQWLYRMWSKSSSPKDVYTRLTQILKWKKNIYLEMWNIKWKKTSSSKLDLEESKNAAVDKKTVGNQAKSTSGGWKSRRSSVSRLPSSFTKVPLVLFLVLLQPAQSESTKLSKSRVQSPQDSVIAGRSLCTKSLIPFTYLSKCFSFATLSWVGAVKSLESSLVP